MPDQTEFEKLAVALVATELLLSSVNEAQSSMQKLGGPLSSLTEISNQLDALRKNIVIMQRSAPIHRTVQ